MRCKDTGRLGDFVPSFIVLVPKRWQCPAGGHVPHRLGVIWQLGRIFGWQKSGRRAGATETVASAPLC